MTDAYLNRFATAVPSFDMVLSGPGSWKLARRCRVGEGTACAVPRHAACCVHPCSPCM
jgi:hypothetical protein